MPYLASRRQYGNTAPYSLPIKRQIHFSLFLFFKDNYSSDRRPETKQGIEGKIDRFRSGRVRVRVSDRVRVRFRSAI